MATVSRIHDWSDGDVVFAADLDAEFDNVVDGVNSISDDNIAANAAILPSKISATIKGAAVSRDGATGALSVKVDNVGLQIAGDALQLKDHGIPGTKLSDAVAGNGLYLSRQGVLNVKDDEASIRISPNYLFTVTSANATVGATYTNNGVTFTVIRTIASGTILECSATGAPQANEVATLNDAGTSDPNDDYYTYTYVPRTLTKTSGTGDGTISYSAWKGGYLEVPEAGLPVTKLKVSTFARVAGVGQYAIDSTIGDVNGNNNDWTDTGHTVTLDTRGGVVMLKLYPSVPPATQYQVGAYIGGNGSGLQLRFVRDGTVVAWGFFNVSNSGVAFTAFEGFDTGAVSGTHVYKLQLLGGGNGLVCIHYYNFMAKELT